VLFVGAGRSLGSFRAARCRPQSRPSPPNVGFVLRQGRVEVGSFRADGGARWVRFAPGGSAANSSPLAQCWVRSARRPGLRFVPRRRIASRPTSSPTPAPERKWVRFAPRRPRLRRPRPDSEGGRTGPSVARKVSPALVRYHASAQTFIGRGDAPLLMLARSAPALARPRRRARGRSGRPRDRLVSGGHGGRLHRSVADAARTIPLPRGAATPIVGIPGEIRQQFRENGPRVSSSSLRRPSLVGDGRIEAGHDHDPCELPLAASPPGRPRASGPPAIQNPQFEEVL
jgi:hypothetical protein